MQIAPTNGNSVAIRFRPFASVIPLLALLGLGGAGVYAIHGAVRLFSSDPKISLFIGAFGFVGLLLPSLFCLYWTIRRCRKPALVIDDHGLTDFTPILGPPLRLEWNQIASVVLVSPRVAWKRIPLALYIVPHDPEAIRATRPSLLRLRLRKAWKVLGFKPVIFVGQDVDVPLAELGSTIARFARVAFTDRSTE